MICVARTATLVLAIGSAAVACVFASDAAPCRADGKSALLAELPEASGLAASRRRPDQLWAINDSGKAIIFALDARGTVIGRIRLTGVAVDDWEAIAVGPCAAGSCLYVADIGDNTAHRKAITIYRLPEPAVDQPSVQVSDEIHATYPDGPQDAESLLATPDGGLYIVTKGSTGPIAIYRVPKGRRPGSVVRLERVGQPLERGKVSEDGRITDGAVSPDGERVVLRTHHTLLVYRTAQLLSGHWRHEQAVDLQRLDEPQGEGVTFGSNGSLYLAGEGGGKKRPGSFLRLVCASLR
jgi:hypothetical protein